MPYLSQSDSNKSAWCSERYQMIRCLGQGAQAVIYLVSEPCVGRFLVLKVYRKTSGTKPGREARILAGLRHESIVQMVDCYMVKEQEVLVLEYVQGKSLDQIRQESGKTNEQEAVRLGIELAGVICYLHSLQAGILHLDLKPQNLLLTDSGSIKLIDFGTAVTMEELEAGSFTRGGTKGYAPYELCGDGDQLPDQRSDIYSFGMTMYSILTGKDAACPPYGERLFYKRNSGLSEGLDHLLQRCIRQKKVDRMGSMEEVKQQLMRLTLPWYKKITPQKEFLAKEEKNIFRTPAAWLCLWIMVVVMVLLSTSASYAAKEKLLVSLRNETGEKLLIQEGSLYYTDKDILFEIEVEHLDPGEEYAFTIIRTGSKEAAIKERTFRIMRQEAERCTENIPKQ